MKNSNTYVFLWILLSLIIVQKTDSIAQSKDQIIKLRQKIKSGKITYKLSESKEIKSILGEPEKETTQNDGGMVLLEMTYSDAKVLFGKYRDDIKSVFTLLQLSISNVNIDIGRNRKLVLRNKDDLKKMDHFWGFQNISLKNINLRNEISLINKMTFDSQTEWPSVEKLPPGFNPTKMFENGKNPGLGVRKLHENGINGKGVGVAIIDQPLLLGHQEYTSQIVRYDATSLSEYPPQMHGSPIASILVGQAIGVAPEAILSYFAVPMWKKDNSYYIGALEKIIELNKILPNEEKIHVVSISDGRFQSNPLFEDWNQVLNKAIEMGILVVTCDPNFLDYGTLTLIENKTPDDPQNYIPGKYIGKNDVLRIPTGNKTIASHRGNDVYTYEREGGMSWAAPYIAGLAALAFQVNPDLKPEIIVEKLQKTSTPTQAGPVVNPQKFIDSIKKL